MHNSKRRQRAPPRNPFRDLRFSHRPKDIVHKGNQTGILLGHAYQRCGANRQDMRSMPEHIPTPIKIFGCNTTHPTHLAITKMGHGSCRTSTTFAGGNKFIVVAIEYFTRWIEAKPLATISLETIKKFFWQNIICRFRVPRTLTVDNGKQFDYTELWNFCSELNIKLTFALVNHPQSIGAIERANGLIFIAISK